MVLSKTLMDVANCWDIQYQYLALLMRKQFKQEREFTYKRHRYWLSPQDVAWIESKLENLGYFRIGGDDDEQ